MSERAVSSLGLVAGLGPAQLVAWGTLYYSIAVMGETMARDFHLARSHVFGAFAWSVLLSGALAPWAGRTLDRVGGRSVLVASALVGAVGFVVLSRAQSWWALIAGWSIQGLAMALGLYDTCFAAIGQAAPAHYRKTLTSVTLVAGFASSVAWPATYYLLASVGWRRSCEIFALAMLVCAPVYWAVLPRVSQKEHARVIASEPTPLSDGLRRQARWLAFAFAGTGLVTASLSAHMIGLLSALHLSGAKAAWLGSSIGAMQVAGRLLEVSFGRRLSPMQLGLATLTCLLGAMILLSTTAVLPSAVYGFVVAYGLANGLLTIAKATVPIEMFGLSRVGAVLGRFAAPSLVARALGPIGFAVLIDTTSVSCSLGALIGVSALSVAAYLTVFRERRAGDDHPSALRV